MRGLAKVASIAGVAVLGIIALALFAVYILSRTPWGWERVRVWGLPILNEQLAGAVSVDAIRSRNGLLTDAMLVGVTVTNAAGDSILHADSASVEYTLRDILFERRFVFRNPTLFAARLTIERLPGDSLWNVERLLPARDTVPGGGVTPLVQFEGIRLLDGHVTVREEAGGNTSPRFVIEQTPAGPMRVVSVSMREAAFPMLRLSAPDRTGVEVRIASLAASVSVVDEPIRIRDVAGRVTWNESVLEVALDRLELPASRAAVNGEITLGRGEPAFDLIAELDALAVEDLHSILPSLPEWGEARGRVAVRSQADGLAITAEDVRFTAPGTEVTGSLSGVLGDAVVLSALDLRLAPLDVSLFAEWIPEGVPRDGRLAGNVHANGVLTALRTSGDLRWVRGDAAATTLDWDGGIGWDRGRASSTGLALRFRNLDLSLLVAAGLDPRIRGVVEGELDVSGSTGTEVLAHGRFVHRAPGGAVSVLDGGGVFETGGTEFGMDLEFRAQPLTLSTLAMFSPALDSLRGEATGTVRLDGTPQDLRIGADLSTDGGSIVGDVHISLGERRAFDGSLRVESFRPAALFAGAPDVTGTASAMFDLEGSEFGDLRGTVEATVDTVLAGDFPVRGGRVVARFADGVATLDTLDAEAAGVLIRARGGFGLVEGRTGTLEIELDVPMLDRAGSVLFPEEGDDPTLPRLEGAVRGQATLTGSIAGFDADATLMIVEARRRRDVVSGADVHLSASGVRTAALTARVEARFDSLYVMGRAFDSTHVSLDYSSGNARVTAFARQHEGNDIRADASVQLGDTVTEVRIAQLQSGEGPDAWALRDTAIIRVAGSRAEIAEFQLSRADGAGRVLARGRLGWRGEDSPVAAGELPLDFDAQLADVPFSEFLRLVRSDANASGTVAGRVRIGGTAATPLIEASLDVDNFTFGEARLDRLGATLDYVGEVAEVHLDGYQGGRRILLAEGTVPVDLRFQGAEQRRLAERLDFSFQAVALPASLVLGFLEPFSDVQGLIDGTVTARGTAADPELTGTLSIRDAAATWAEMGVRYYGVGGQFRFTEGMRLQIDLLAGQAAALGGAMAGGSFRVSGEVDLTQMADPEFTGLTVQANNLLAARRRDVQIVASGDVRIRGRYTRPIVSGDLRIDRGTLNIDELYRQYLLVGLGDPLLLEVIDTSLASTRRVLPESENPFIRNLVVDSLTVSVGTETWLRSREMNVEVTTAGDPLIVDFDRRQEDLRVSGRLSVGRGTYTLEGPGFARIFQVRSGTVSFAGTPGFDPNLDITASHRARTQSGPLEILVLVSGSLESPRVRLTSDEQPPISESDLASYLFFGAPTYAFNLGSSSLGGGGGEGALFGSLGVQAITASGLGYVSGGLQAIGQQLGIVDYVGLTAAESAPGEGPRSGLGGILANTEISLGRYLTPELFVAWTQRIGTPGATPGVRLEWQVSPTFTGEIYVEDRFARGVTIGLSQAVAARRVYAIFLYREWGY